MKRYWLLALALGAILFVGCKCSKPLSVYPDAGFAGLPAVIPSSGAAGAAGAAAAEPEPEPDPADCQVLEPTTKGPRVLLRKTPRIVGGELCRPGAHPWAVALESRTGIQFCGGTLIGAQWVLTAAHCEVRVDEYAVIGKTDLREGGGEKIRIDGVRTHGWYRGVEYGYDVAVLHLATPSQATPALLAPYAWQPPAEALPVTQATVIGWGLEFESAPATSPLLRQVVVPILPQDECAAAYSGGIMRTMLCAGYEEGGRDSCQGDSGGGMFQMLGGVWKQVGIVSWGEGCARPGKPGVYTNVAAVRPWIRGCTAAR